MVGLGNGGSAVDENIANAVGLESPKGALVANIVDDSPASKAGIRIEISL